MFRSAAIIFCLLPSTAQALDLKKLSANYRQQAAIIKDNRNRTDRLDRIADAYKWSKYKKAEKAYVASLKKAYKLQLRPKELVGANARLYFAAKDYRKQIDSLFKSLNLRGATVGQTRYGPLEGFDKAFNEFVRITD